MKIPVKLSKEEVIALYGKSELNKYLTKDATKKEVNDAIGECGTVINFIQAPTKDQYELAIRTYPQAFAHMPKEYQTVQNSCDAVKADITNLEYCILIDPEIISAALTIPKLKTFHVKKITEYAAKADYEPLLNESSFPKYIKAFPKQYQPLCAKYGRARLAPLLKPEDITEIVSSNPMNAIYLEVPIDDPAWMVIAKNSPEFIFRAYREGKIEKIPYGLVLTALINCPEVAAECDYGNSEHVSAIASALFHKPETIQYVPIERLTESMIMTAIVIDPASVIYVPNNRLTSGMVNYVLDKNPNLIKYLSRHDIPTETILRAIEADFDNIVHLKVNNVSEVVTAMCPNIPASEIANIKQHISANSVIIAVQDIIYQYLNHDNEQAMARWAKGIEVSMYRPASNALSIESAEHEVTTETISEEAPAVAKGVEIHPVDGDDDYTTSV